MYSKAKEILLKAVHETNLPIVITGKQGTGKRHMSEYFNEKYNRKELKPSLMSYPEIVISLQKNTDNLVIVTEHKEDTKTVESLLNDLIKIKCFKVNGTNVISHHIIEKEVNLLNTTLRLSDETPVIWINGATVDEVRESGYVNSTGILVDKGNVTKEHIKRVYQQRLSGMQALHLKSYRDANLKPYQFVIDSSEFETYDTIIPLLKTLRAVGIWILFADKEGSKRDVTSKYTDQVVNYRTGVDSVKLRMTTETESRVVLETLDNLKGRNVHIDLHISASMCETMPTLIINVIRKTREFSNTIELGYTYEEDVPMYVKRELR